MLGSVKTVDGAPIALIVPHAGYAYSGSVAATGFAQLRNGELRYGSDHRSRSPGAHLRPDRRVADGAFETPLGAVPVDFDLAKALIAADPRIKADRAAHQGEHMIEIELPFLQQVCPNCSIVPVLMGRDEEASRVLADALSQSLPGRKAVVIAELRSLALSHLRRRSGRGQRDPVRHRNRGPKTVRGAIAKSMGTHNSQLVTCACGEAAILVAMEVAPRLGADTTTILRYSNSGDIPQADRTGGGLRRSDAVALSPA